jgi:hypothetical protein
MKKFCKYGLAFALIHLVVFVVYVFYVAGVAERDGQAQLLWIVWLLIDFPISLLIFLAKGLGISSITVLYVIHGVLGTIWWYFIPSIFFKFSLKK